MLRGEVRGDGSRDQEDFSCPGVVDLSASGEIADIDESGLVVGADDESIFSLGFFGKGIVPSSRSVFGGGIGHGRASGEGQDTGGQQGGSRVFHGWRIAWRVL